MGLGNKEIMAKNIRYYMEKFGKTRGDMCKALGVKYTTFTDWVNGNSYPRIDKIELMANYFGINKSDLVEEHKEDNDSPAMQDLIQTAKAADDDDIRQATRLLAYLNALRKEKDNAKG